MKTDSSKKNFKSSTPMSQRAMARERVAKNSMPDSIEVVWHCIPSYFQILKLFSRLLYKMTSKVKDTGGVSHGASSSNSTAPLHPAVSKRYVSCLLFSPFALCISLSLSLSPSLPLSRSYPPIVARRKTKEAWGFAARASQKKQRAV